MVYNYPRLNIITGFAAKNVCSCTFVADRKLKSIESEDNGFSPIKMAKNKIDFEEKSVTSTVFGLKKRKAVYREGLGCVLLPENNPKSRKIEEPNRNLTPIQKPFPYGNLEPKDSVFANIDYDKLNQAIENAFDEDIDSAKKKTKAVLVVYKDHIIGEKYMEGYNKDTRLLGWSMTKSLTNTMFGILQKDSIFDIHKPAPVEEWKKDDRRKITTKELLKMNSGLEWVEDYNSISDVTKMLFQASNMTKPQAEKREKHKPNKFFNYSSGTTNLLSGILREQFETHQEYLDFPYKSFIDKMGMHSMLIETDCAGNYVLSSYGWANTRDWAKFGLLYLHKGNWDGEQIIKESWVGYTHSPAPNSDDRYGEHFWINKGGFYPNSPRDMYSANGYQGQRIFIIPSKDMVIVRLGYSETDRFDFDGLVSKIVASVK
ncbi:serine hydrolase domain-containing protein [Aureivirga marina]|uniref:serine hydrolase domain-containing protein n=1 Tax=Aureivirga marina TaxID=1182451 RepID=UPI00293D45A6|nr:serine hydrolase [Aureivirga marina]